LDLSLKQNIPATLLILANTFKMTETLNLRDALRETLYHLPESVIDEIRLKMEQSSEQSRKLQLLKEESRRIAEESAEAEKTAEAIRSQELQQWMSKDLASNSITFSASQLKQVADAVAEGM
jgi:FKBP-type peptidyl-prolyl cis-trans isomerase